MSVRVEGYTFVAVVSPTGIMHLAWAEHFGPGMFSGDRAPGIRYRPPPGTTLCGRTGNEWTQVGAKDWYEPPPEIRKCLFCGPKIGPYATVKL